ncbi:MAG: DUF4198 domain-containing protein [Gemmatimonadales bacterium]
MRFRAAVTASLLLCVASLVNAHDLFIKLESYFLAPHATVTIPILNGSFVLSENAITRDRVIDIALVSAAGRMAIDTTAWAGDTAYSDTTFLTIKTGDPGTYVVGASTEPRDLGLAAADFNDYLEHDGIPDVLEARRRSGELDKDVRERYAKHVKAVLQVGDLRDDAYRVELGYPAEVVALVNPYSLAVGDEYSFLCLVDGEPVANQLVILGGERGGELVEEVRKRTDDAGTITFVIDSPGKWYVEFIHMAPSEEPDIDYESKWATVAFEVR